MIGNEVEFSITILVVDGDESTRRLLDDTLTALGYKIILAGDLESARRSLEVQKIDLVMCNAIMPGGNGVIFLMQMKKERPQIPVIMLTSVINDEAGRRLLDAGADGVLAKPFRINRVEELIVTTLLRYDRPGSPRVPMAKKRILVIDDDRGLLDFMMDGLETLGYEAHCRLSGAEGVAAFIDTNFDLVISDFMLSDISGAELLVKLRETKKNVPFVIITGYPLAYPAVTAEADGVDGYLVKPFRIHQMEQVIASLLYPEKSKIKS